MLDETRRERDGRPARSKAAKAPYQVRKRADGSEYYVAQLVDPRTGRRVTLRGDTIPQICALIENVRTVRRKLAAGLMSQEDAAQEAFRAQGTVYVRDLWRDYARATLSATGDTKGEAWRAKLPGIWKAHWAYLLEGKVASEVNDALLQRWEEHQRTRANAGKPYAPASIALAWQALGACMRLAVRMGKLGRLPWLVYRFKADRSRSRIGRQRGKASSWASFAALVAAAHERAKDAERWGELPDLPMRLVVMVVFSLRRGEAIALRWERIDFAAGLVHVREQARERWTSQIPKGVDRRAAIPADPLKTEASERSFRFEAGGLVDRALRAQRALLQSRGLYRPTGPVFPRRDGAFRARNLIEPAHVRALAQAAGLQRDLKWVQHSLRHTGASLAVAMGANLNDVMKGTGHTRVDTVQIYFQEHGAEATRSIVGDVRGDALGLPHAEAAEEEQTAAAELASAVGWIDGPVPHAAVVSARFDAVTSDAERTRLAKRSGHVELGAEALRAARAGELGIPRVVAAEFRAAYSRAYAKARKAGLSLEEQRRRGAFASRALKAAWGRMRAAAGKQVAAEALAFAGQQVQGASGRRAEHEHRGHAGPGADGDGANPP